MYRLIERFGSLAVLFGVTLSDLADVEGVDHDLARRIRDGLVRLAEAGYDR